MIVNGEEVDVLSGTTLQAYLESNGYVSGTVAVEKNGVIVPRDSFASETLRGGDKMEVVTFMGGGSPRVTG